MGQCCSHMNAHNKSKHADAPPPAQATPEINDNKQRPSVCAIGLPSVHRKNFLQVSISINGHPDRLFKGQGGDTRSSSRGDLHTVVDALNQAAWNVSVVTWVASF